jgi:catechol 2,3-dioxygenase-like lactoylglutathione lyase family enzyme
MARWSHSRGDDVFHCADGLALSHSRRGRLSGAHYGNSDVMIGKLRSVVVDCKDPAALARFYEGLLGGSLHEEDHTWSVLTEPTGRRLAFQLAPEHEPPRFPDPRGSQQFHLDIEVDDVDAAEKDVLALGATRVTDAVEDDTYRVYRDPAGHTFCLVWGVPSDESS